MATRKLRSAEDVCIEYARIAGLIREESAKISPWHCERAATSEFRPGWPSGTTPIDPCISTLFQKRDEENEGYQQHRDWQDEFEEEMCDACKECLKHVRARRELRLKMGVAKRAVTAVGKRLAKAKL
jgi:hypothetical protein